MIVEKQIRVLIINFKVINITRFLNGNKIFLNNHHQNKKNLIISKIITKKKFIILIIKLVNKLIKNNE